MSEEEENRVYQLLRQHASETAEWRTKMSDRLEKMQAELTANTEVTTAVRDAYTAGKVATRLVKYIAGVALSSATIWWAVREIFGHGTPGGGIGPTP